MRNRALGILLEAFALAGAHTLTSPLSPQVGSLKVQMEEDFFAPPVLRLHDPRVRLAVDFDLLEESHRYLRASLEHLTPEGEPSPLAPSEYASGFNEVSLEDYAYSQNTFRHYVNYRLLLPCPGLEPLVSGLYLLRVYDEAAPDSALVQVRFAVSEDAGSIAASCSHITDRGSAGGEQQLSFVYDPGQLQLRDPFADVTALVIQNSDPSRRMVKPLRLEGRRLVYEHMPSLIFPAGHEFRRFETVRADYAGMHTASVAYEDDGYSARLERDRGRAGGAYQYDVTQQGRFKIDEYNASDPSLGADYIMTHFTLDFPRVMNGDVYVDGEFTHHRLDESTRMVWDEASHLYRLPMLLKQGSYNYRYVLAGEGSGGRPDPSPVEGNFYETRNEYAIYIFYTPPGARYARLLQAKSIR